MTDAFEAFKNRISENAMRIPSHAFRVVKERLEASLDANSEYIRSPELERAILSGFLIKEGEETTSADVKNRLDSWKFGAKYAIEVLGDRWPELEKAFEEAEIEQDVGSLTSLLSYSKLAGKEWKGAEKHLTTDPVFAVRYATEVTKDRFSADHPVVNLIRQDVISNRIYENSFQDESSRSLRR
jgi:hypothetical protein